MMINLDLTPDEADGLGMALSLAENVNEHLDEAQQSAAGKLDAALAAAAGEPEPPAPDRYPEPAPDAGAGAPFLPRFWDAAYPVLTDDTARLILHEILFDAGFMRSAIDCDDSPGGVTVLDALRSFQGNCWDDQHEGGAHRQDLIDVNRLFGWLRRADLQDELGEVLALVADDAPDDVRWGARP